MATYNSISDRNFIIEQYKQAFMYRFASDHIIETRATLSESPEELVEVNIKDLTRFIDDNLEFQIDFLKTTLGKTLTVKENIFAVHRYNVMTSRVACYTQKLIYETENNLLCIENGDEKEEAQNKVEKEVMTRMETAIGRFRNSASCLLSEEKIEIVTPILKNLVIAVE